jgi:hypothetical protein
MIDGDVISVTCLELLTLKPVKTLRMYLSLFHAQ